MDAILVGSVMIPVSEIELTFSRSGGPGGQNVNKVESKVTLRFALLQSPSVPPQLKQRAANALANDLTKMGEIVFSCDRSRSQWQNRSDCLQKLRDMLQEAFRPPKIRRKTKPSRSSKTKRMDSKRLLGEKKRLRRDRDD